MKIALKLSALFISIIFIAGSCKKAANAPTLQDYMRKMSTSRTWAGVYDSGVVYSGTTRSPIVTYNYTDTFAIAVAGDSTITMTNHLYGPIAGCGVAGNNLRCVGLDSYVIVFSHNNQSEASATLYYYYNKDSIAYQYRNGYEQSLQTLQVTTH